MRGFAILASLALLSYSAPAMAQRSSSRAVIACMNDADRPICLLRAVSLYPTMSLRTDPDFADAPAVVRAVEEDSPAPAKPDAYTRAEIEPRLSVARAVDHAVSADRRGEQPARALQSLNDVGRGLQAQSFVLGQIRTRSGAEHRISGYAEIWRRYREQGEGALSVALARGALAAWEEDLRDVDAAEVYGPLDLALAYESLGDERAVDRLVAGNINLARTFQLRRAVAAGDLDASARIAAQYDGADVSGALYSKAVEAAIARLVAAERGAAASDVVGAVLQNSSRANDGSLARLVGALPRPQGLEIVEQLDRRARLDAGVQSAQAALYASAGWTALGQRERASALIDIWRPRAEAQIGANCGGDASPCLQSYVAQMLRWADRLNEAAPFATPSAVLMYDRVDGYGISRLDERLAHFPSDGRTDDALEGCVRHYANAADWMSARTCLDRLMSTGARRPLLPHIQTMLEADPDQPGFGGPYAAASAAFTLAAHSAKGGRYDIADAAFADGVSALEAAPDARLSSFASSSLRDYAHALLQREGRVPAN